MDLEGMTSHPTAPDVQAKSHPQRSTRGEGREVWTPLGFLLCYDISKITFTFSRKPVMGYVMSSLMAAILDFTQS